MTLHEMTLPNGEGWVIGIGASAGGLEALTLLISNLPKNFSSTIIVAQHLAPHAKSMMVELLQRQSHLPVVAARDRLKIEPKTIYVVPPNHDIDLVDQEILLTVAGNETRPKPSVDTFFESLARAYGDRAVGVILSGTGSDGSDGIQAIKAVGGVTLAQDDRSAKYDGMPRSAVNTGDIDSIMPPDQMAKDLPQLLADHDTRLRMHKMDEHGLDKILSLVRKQQGTDFRMYKLSTIQRRVAKRMSTVRVGSYDNYLQILEQNPAEVAQLSQEMLVSVTSFFRDSEVFESLQNFVDRLVTQKKSGDEIRVWVAGCATGEEAYSLAMLFQENLDRQRKHVFLKVFATDLDQDAIFEARNGIYTEKECETLPEELLHKYFDFRNGSFEVTKKLREIVVFARQDLSLNPPFVKLDMISCRNVLIYFDTELQKKVIEIFHYALNVGAVLLLGRSESVAAVSHLFEPLDRGSKIYSKLNVPSKPLPATRTIPVEPFRTGNRSRPQSGPSIAELSYLKLLNSYEMAGATIDEEGNIVQMIGDVSPYLGFFTPQADFRITNLLPKGVGIEIPILLRKAQREGGTHKSRYYKIDSKQRSLSFRIGVRALFDSTELPDSKRLFVINFEAKKKSDPQVTLATVEGEIATRVSELEQELFVTREHLQTVIEELGVTNEELQSVNEELSSTNEELQASSEELETTNEELQSSNEELTTVNEELIAKQSEIRALNVSFENVQNSIGSPLVILDAKKRIIRYNPEALKVFRISPGDVGREISAVSSNFEVPDFNERLNECLTRGQSSETVTEAGHSIFQMRILPCFDDHQKITGVVLIFIDNSAVLKSQERLTSSEQQMRAIMDGSESLIFMKDTLGRYMQVNEAFRRFFSVSDEQILGKTDREVFPDKLALSFRESDLDVFVRRTSSKRLEAVTSKDGQTHWFLASRFPLMESKDSNPYAVGTVAVDVSSQMAAQENLTQSELRYRSIVEDQAVFVCRHRPDGLLTFFNTVFASQFRDGLDPKAGQTFLSVVADADRGRMQQALSTITIQQPTVQVEHRTTPQENGVRWLRWIHKGLFDEKGQLVEIQSVGFDVTESRKKTDQLIDKESIYSSVFDHSVDFLSVFRIQDGEFILESFNRSAEKALSTEHRHLTGQNLKDLADPEKAHDLLARYTRCALNRKAEVFDEQIETPSGIRHYSTTLVFVPSTEGGEGRIAAISRDISSYKRIEADLRRSKVDADAANRSKSDFLASMSHELRTPLNVVLGMSQLLVETPLDHDQNSYVGSIYRSGKVLLSLIEDVLDVAKIEAGKITLETIPFKPTDVVNETLDLFARQASDKKITLVAELSPEAQLAVIGDPARLRQVLVNLVGNAVKFTEKGSVSVEMKLLPNLNGHSRFFEFRVRDTGIGISNDSHQRLFQRFSQVESGHNRKYGGSGLGLMISKNLVTLMGGRIGFDSEPGSGSTFWVQIPFPLCPVEKVGPEKNLPTHLLAADQKTQSLRILAVDDNDDSRTLIGLFVRRLGHQVTLASGGRDALNKIESHYFDLVLMDVQMPDMDGYEVTSHIRKLPRPKSQTPVVALTANAMAGDADRALEAGMNDYLTKPVHVQSLKDLIAKWSASADSTKPPSERN